MKKVVSLLISVVFALVFCTGSVWASPDKERESKDLIFSLASATQYDVGEEDVEDEDNDLDEDEEDVDDTDKDDADEDDADEDEDADKDKIEYVTEDGLHVEIKDGKIEIKGKGAKFEFKNNNSFEFKSKKGKVEIDEDEIEIKGDVLGEFKQKLNIYNEIVNKGTDLGNKFSDIEGHWAESTLESMSAIGLLEGYEDGSFQPDNSITQAEVITLLMRMISDEELVENTDSNEVEDEVEDGDENKAEDEDETTNEEEEEEDNLSNVPEWARNSVGKAAKNGFININRFHSQVQATRAQSAVWIAKALGLEPVNCDEIPFNDGILITPEDLGYIMALYEEGIIVGTPDGNFNPNSEITRSQIAVIMQRILTSFDDGSDDTDTTDDTTEPADATDDTDTTDDTETNNDTDTTEDATDNTDTGDTEDTTSI